jgi:membrane-bound lytic murein transglycosylase D
VAEDTLSSVAQTYHVSVAELAAANQMGEGEKLEGVEALIVPVPPSAAPSARGLLYTTRRGDTLVSIADRFGVSLSQLRRWNNLSGVAVAPGRRLHVAEPARVVRAGASRRRNSSGSTSSHSGTTAAKTAGTHSSRSGKRSSGGSKAGAKAASHKKSSTHPSSSN